MSQEWRCDGCNTCNGCDGCNSCNKVIGLCDTNQTASAYLGNFAWKKADRKTRTNLSTNSEFFTKEEWNSLVNYIEKAYSLGTTNNAKDSYDSIYTTNIKANTTNNTHMKALMYNEAYRRMRNLELDNRNTTYQKVQQGDLITHGLFNDLYDLANSFQLHPYQCDNCVTCNSCLSCNGCNSCESDYTSYCCHTESEGNENEK